MTPRETGRSRCQRACVPTTTSARDAENGNERCARAMSLGREDWDAPPMALRAETALAAGATRATRAELAMADMGRIDAKVRATRYAAIPRGRVLIERRRCQLTGVPAQKRFYWARTDVSDMRI